MRSAILYCFALVAMSLALIMPAQASEGYEGFEPLTAGAAMVDAGVGSGDVIGPKRISVRQLEAADTQGRPINEGLIVHGADHIYCAHAHVAMLAGAKPEVGWRSSPTAT